jgi:hypothetical protein
MIVDNFIAFELLPPIGGMPNAHRFIYVSFTKIVQISKTIFLRFSVSCLHEISGF